MFGFLNVYKPVGKTSHDVVAILRKVLKIKQIGHTGTLDPFAEGVLPVCIGKATRLIEYLNDDKAYLATVKFGSSTETYDVEGDVTFTSDKKVDEISVQNALFKFAGEIEQIPPKYSAIKLNGKKLYEYARSGQEVEIKPRKVNVTQIELKDFDYDNQIAKIYIECSKGTYIRSIANDLGEYLECGAHLINLVRTKAGKFLIDSAIKLEDLTTFEFAEKNILNPLQFLDLPTYCISDIEYKKVLNGNSFVNKNIKSVDFIILIYNNNIAAIANVKDGCVKVNKVFCND